MSRVECVTHLDFQTDEVIQEALACLSVPQELTPAVILAGVTSSLAGTFEKPCAKTIVATHSDRGWKS